MNDSTKRPKTPLDYLVGALALLGTITLLASLGESLVIGVRFLSDLVSVYRAVIYPFIDAATAWFPREWPEVSSVTVDVSLVSVLVISRPYLKPSTLKEAGFYARRRVLYAFAYLVGFYLGYDVLSSDQSASFYVGVVGVMLGGIIGTSFQISLRPRFRVGLQYYVSWSWVLSGFAITFLAVAVYALNEHADVALPAAERLSDAATKLWQAIVSFGVDARGR
jgi:hypothetical protein